MRKYFFSVLLFALSAVQAYAACPSGTTIGSGKIDRKEICVIEGNYANHNLVLTPDYAWVLKGDVRFGTGAVRQNNTDKVAATLTLEAGTVVYGSPQSFITITRDAQIFVKGTAAQPVVFTALDQVNPTPGYWGGVVITGNARINNCKTTSTLGFCEGFIEGVASEIAPRYGGPNDQDSSGSIEYLRVEYAGYTFGTDSELNAITFYAVGNQTKVEYIQAYKGADDGVELFGGTVNLRYVVSTDNDDDGFDWDQGWSGAAQFIYITLENASEKDPNGIEADNFKDNHSVTPRSNPTLSNITIIGKGKNPKLFNGIMLRHGTGGRIYNTLVAGNFQNCLNIDSDETFRNGGEIVNGQVQQTGLVMENIILQCNQNQIAQDSKDLWSVEEWFYASVEQNNYVKSPTENLLDADGVTPLAQGPALKTGYLPPEDIFPGGFEFIPVDYVGAFGSSLQKWTDGWTLE
ncbi:MAG: hypothetical protein M9899_07215 [Bdellovibrionaceae bacterium]|nr:hypothetical protein [Pseudobdellovibrionaceae bacterium]